MHPRLKDKTREPAEKTRQSSPLRTLQVSELIKASHEVTESVAVVGQFTRINFSCKPFGKCQTAGTTTKLVIVSRRPCLTKTCPGPVSSGRIRFGTVHLTDAAVVKIFMFCSIN